MRPPTSSEVERARAHQPGGRRSTGAWLALLLSSPCGCGGGLPLLHPAQVLPPGVVRASAGFSADVAALGLADALDAARREAAPPAGGAAPATPTDATFAKGALVAASIAPGLAPVAGARVGIADQFEGGIAYTGRAVRIDLRRAFDLAPHWALSVGAAGSAAFYGAQPDDPLPNVDLARLRGWGGDLPVLVGYASDGGLYAVWVGARAGFEHAEASDLRDGGGAADAAGGGPLGLSATNVWAGGVFGLAAGFRHLHLALEIDAAYANVSGDYGPVHAQVEGVSIAPAGALWWSF